MIIPNSSAYRGEVTSIPTEASPLSFLPQGLLRLRFSSSRHRSQSIMCTRYVFTDPAEAIRDLFSITAPLPNWPPSYNVAPTHIMPVIRPTDGGREIAMMEWGLVPYFSKDGKRRFTTFNARAEELRSRAMYREPFRNGRRCIVPATGYIEFTEPTGGKTAHLFTRTDGKPVALAGLWDRWASKYKAEKKETYTVVTTSPSQFAAQFHDRMPCVLKPEDIDAWLRASPDEAAALMRPAKDVLQERPLGKAINNVKNNEPKLLALFDPQ